MQIYQEIIQKRPILTGLTTPLISDITQSLWRLFLDLSKKSVLCIFRVNNIEKVKENISFFRFWASLNRALIQVESEKHQKREILLIVWKQMPDFWSGQKKFRSLLLKKNQIKKSDQGTDQIGKNLSH